MTMQADELADALSPQEFEPHKRAMVAQNLGHVTRLVRAEAPERTGALRRSVSSRLISPEKGEVQVTAPHAGLVLGGTRRHAIVARHAKVLRFSVGGRVVFRRSVMHPGTKPNPFLDRALDQAKRYAGDEMQREGNRFFAKVARR